MARVTGFSAERMLAIENSTVVDGEIIGDNLHLQKRDGTLLNTGNVRGPKGTDGINVMAGGIWSSGTSYKMNDTVGYAGQVWTAKFDNTNKVPIYNPDYWRPITGYDTSGWYQLDPNFIASDFNTGWQTFWGTGTAVTTLTSTIGEFETGHQALKVALGENSSRRLYEHNENLVYEGEMITAHVRAKMGYNGSSADPQIQCVLFQSDEAGNPEPFGAGSEQTNALQGKQTLTENWETYEFKMLANGTKPRARVNVIAEQGTGSSEVFIDRVTVERTSPENQISKGSYALTLNPSIFQPYYANSGVMLKWEGNFVELSGIIKPMVAGIVNDAAGSSSNQIATLPPEFRPSFDRVFSCAASGSNHWALHVKDGGPIYATRYGPADQTVGNWLPFSVSWMI